MIEFLTEPAFLSGASVGAITVLAAIAQGSNRKSLRRIGELGAAKSALEAHFDAMDTIVDDPALPLEALEMLVNFSEAITSPEFCRGLTDSMTGPFPENERLPKWFSEVDALRRTRPELAANFFAAISSGLVVAFLRWPGNAWKLPLMAAALAHGDRKEAVLAERVSEMKRRSPHQAQPVPA